MSGYSGMRHAMAICVGICVGEGFWFLLVLFCVYIVSTSGRGTYRPPCHVGWGMRG